MDKLYGGVAVGAVVVVMFAVDRHWPGFIAYMQCIGVSLKPISACVW